MKQGSTAKPDRDRKLIEYYLSDRSIKYKDCVEKFKISRQRIHRILQKYGISNQSKYRVLYDKVRQMHDDGYTMSEVCNVLHISRKKLDDICRDLNIDISSWGNLIERRNSLNRDIVQYIEDHPDARYADVAKHFNTSSSYISGVMIRSGKKRRYVDGTRRDEVLAYMSSHPDESVADVAKYFNLAKITIYKYKQGKI